jgi:hypothetical protein
MNPAKLERDTNERVTRNGPVLILGVGNVAIDSIRDVSRDLSKGGGSHQPVSIRR